MCKDRKRQTVVHLSKTQVWNFHEQLMAFYDKEAYQTVGLIYRYVSTS